MSSTTNSIFRINNSLEKISGLDGIVGDLIKIKADEIEVLVYSIQEALVEESEELALIKLNMLFK